MLDRVAGEYEEQLAPAIERVWHDEIGELRRDLGIWVQKLADEHDWIPEYFEFSFGLNDEGRDPASLHDPVTIDGRFMLRGSVDLIEAHAQFGVLRVTDHKTGKNRSNPDLDRRRRRGAPAGALQRGRRSRGSAGRSSKGRLFYCTTAGGFGEHDDRDQRLHARPGSAGADDRRSRGRARLSCRRRRRTGACRWCDFRPVCGPREEERVAPQEPRTDLADLAALRSMR